jgi:hypothetical protein
MFLMLLQLALQQLLQLSVPVREGEATIPGFVWLTVDVYMGAVYRLIRMDCVLVFRVLGFWVGLSKNSES